MVLGKDSILPLLVLVTVTGGVNVKLGPTILLVLEAAVVEIIEIVEIVEVVAVVAVVAVCIGVGLGRGVGEVADGGKLVKDDVSLLLEVGGMGGVRGPSVDLPLVSLVVDVLLLSLLVLGRDVGGENGRGIDVLIASSLDVSTLFQDKLQ